MSFTCKVNFAAGPTAFNISGVTIHLRKFKSLQSSYRATGQPIKILKFIMK